MTTVMLYSAAFSGSFSRLILINPCTSFRSVAYTRFYDPTFIEGAVPAMLHKYDLPDLAASMAPMMLAYINPLNGEGKASSDEIIEEDLSIIRNGYRFRNAEDRFILVRDKFTFANIEKLLNN
jgi:hypothetical protein